jgi:hypothetical protein
VLSYTAGSTFLASTFAPGYGMNHLLLSVVVQFSFAFGVAGLLWPERLVSVFDVLMFPWPATYKLVRANAWGALLLSVILFAALLAGMRA